MHIAERSLFLATTRLLWALNFNQPIDSETREVLLLQNIDEYIGGVTVKPVPFDLTIVPRTEAKEQNIKYVLSETKEASLNKETKQWERVLEGMALST
jgi:hypothetical protein